MKDEIVIHERGVELRFWKDKKASFIPFSRIEVIALYPSSLRIYLPHTDTYYFEYSGKDFEKKYNLLIEIYNTI